MQKLTLAQAKKQFPKAIASALDGEGPAGDMVDLKEMTWLRDGEGKLYGVLPGNELSQGSVWANGTWRHVNGNRYE